MNINSAIGIFLLLVSVVTIIFAFLIAIKQYISLKPSIDSLPTDLVKLFLQLLSDILKAPPALAFLVVGVLIGAVGIWILVVKPI